MEQPVGRAAWRGVCRREIPSMEMLCSGIGENQKSLRGNLKHPSRAHCKGLLWYLVGKSPPLPSRSPGAAPGCQHCCVLPRKTSLEPSAFEADRVHVLGRY